MISDAELKRASLNRFIDLSDLHMRDERPDRRLYDSLCFSNSCAI